MTKLYCRILQTDSAAELRRDLSSLGVEPERAGVLLDAAGCRIACVGPLESETAAQLQELAGEIRTPLETVPHPFAGERYYLFSSGRERDLIELASVLEEDRGRGYGLAETIRMSLAPPREFTIDLRGIPLRLGQGPVIMGILNVTPDSFSDGGRYLSFEAALARAREMVDEGADIIDVGAESSRPGSSPVDEEEEISRLLPVVEGLLQDGIAPVSVDTYKPLVAEAALRAGAHMVNDISGLKFFPELASVAAEYGAPMVLMHMKGKPKTMQLDPKYRELIGEIIDSLAGSIECAAGQGLSAEQTIVDPGIGFGKTFEDNLVILRRLREFTCLGRPILVGPSRKSFIGQVLDLPVEERLEGSIAAAACAVLAGADILRVHDVKATVRAARLTHAVRSSRRSAR